MVELIPFIMFLCACGALMVGYPVAFTLAGVSLICAGAGIITGHFDAALLKAYPERVFGTVNNATLIAVPLFVLMGVIFERSRLAEQLLDNMSKLCGRLPGGMAISVVIVGMFLAACTGIVGATVITLGLMSLPAMLKKGYSPEISTGTICATGTLGQIIPPSIALVLLGDILSSAYQQAQLQQGIFNPKPVSVGDLFIGAIVPGLLLVALYIVYLAVRLYRQPTTVEKSESGNQVNLWAVLGSLLAPATLIVLVLGSIVAGAATPTEAAGVGAMGAFLLAWFNGSLDRKKLGDIVRSTTQITAMVFTILIGASLFSLVFRGFGGEHLVTQFFQGLPGGVITATLLVMLVIFLLGFILDFIEITFVVVPIVAPVLLMMGLDPIWLGIMIALNLQTSFLTPPFGFALFYLRGVAPSSVPTSAIYRGVIPYIVLQLALMTALAIWPGLITGLPELLR